MRFDPNQKTSAYDLVNFASEEELSRIFWEYGRKSRKKNRRGNLQCTRKADRDHDDACGNHCECRAYQSEIQNNPATKSFRTAYRRK